MQVLDTLRLREDLVADDLRGKEWLPMREKVNEGLSRPLVQPQA
jgi:hypothetical protein